MWFLDGRSAPDVIAAGQRPEPMPYEEWLRLDNPLEGAGPAAERLRVLLGLPEEDPGAKTISTAPKLRLVP